MILHPQVRLEELSQLYKRFKIGLQCLMWIWAPVTELRAAPPLLLLHNEKILCHLVGGWRTTPYNTFKGVNKKLCASKHCIYLPATSIKHICLSKQH